jgi:sulfate adenylyltransferase small subunit
MCGIAGLIDWRAATSADALRAAGEAMNETLRHRGPDDSGIWAEAESGVVLGQRRLAIIDLSPGGAQPMHSADRRYVITFNGEIYNYRDIRKELAAAGRAMRSDSDTEVLLEACALWGVERAIERTIGMFAFGLRQALDKLRFDAAFGGARRDEEKSRAKERIFSHRSANHAWDPRNQRPELWRLFNTHIKPGESMRVFPLSNWTELDVWEYIRAEKVPVVPLYFAKKRPVVERGGTLIMVDDERLPLLPGEAPRMMRVRFRTLGCYPLTGAIRSDADTLDAIIAEMRASTRSERQGRVIDHDEAASMEKKKREGYF